MVATAEKLKPEQQLQSFDPAASINMMRYDINVYGHVLPETQQRIYDEELTFIAEGIDRHSYTQFTLKDSEEGLTYFDKGQWKPYIGTLLTGLQVAEAEAKQDPRRGFMAEMAAKDLQVGYNMQNLKAGESFAWHSAFPEKELQAHGPEFMTEAGFQVERRMGFIYRAEKLKDGSVMLESHTVDNSNPKAFEAAMFEAQFNADAKIGNLIQAYDASLHQQTGKIYRAGRNNFMAAKEENAWSFVKRNKSLFNYYFSELSNLAHSNMSYDQVKTAKSQLMYGVWARTKELLNEETAVGSTSFVLARAPDDHNAIAQQVLMAHHSAAMRKEVMAGCGGSIKAMSNILGLDDPLEELFGEQKTKEELSWHGGKIKIGTCVECEKGPKEVGVESWCKDCISGHCG